MSEPKESLALTLAIGLCRDVLGTPTAAELDRGLDGVLAGIASSKARLRRWGRWSLAGVAVALCSLAILQVTSVLRKRWSAREAPALAYRVDGGRVLEGGYLRESGHVGMTVVFNEGSRLALAPGTRSRLRVVDRDSAHVAIERGGGFFQVAHKTNRRWLADVGPFTVTVTGTVFTVSWDPLSEEFDLRLREGSVLVSGPVSAGEIALRAGQRLVANLARAQTVITEETPEQASSESHSAHATKGTAEKVVVCAVYGESLDLATAQTQEPAQPNRQQWPPHLR